MNPAEAYSDFVAAERPPLHTADSGPPPPGRPSDVDKIVGSLLTVLHQEADMLSQGGTSIDMTITRQKLQLLMHLNRVAPDPEALQGPTLKMLRKARELLDANALKLKRRMGAIKEIADLISREITSAQSDGTYDVKPGRGYSSF